MAFRTTYTRIGDLVIEHKIETPDAPAVVEETPAVKPKRKRAKMEESPSDSSDENPTA